MSQDKFELLQKEYEKQKEQFNALTQAQADNNNQIQILKKELAQFEQKLIDALEVGDIFKSKCGDFWKISSFSSGSGVTIGKNYANLVNVLNDNTLSNPVEYLRFWQKVSEEEVAEAMVESFDKKIMKMKNSRDEWMSKTSKEYRLGGSINKPR